MNVGNRKPIPSEIASKYLYGISGINFSLKDYSTYSVVYQIYINDIGWLPCESDGKELMYKYDKPFSAFRMNIVPKSDKQYLIDYWNLDTNK